jgi:hypothetical protein
MLAGEQRFQSSKTLLLEHLLVKIPEAARGEIESGSNCVRVCAALGFIR